MTSSSSTTTNNSNGNGNSLKLYYWYGSFYSQRVLMALYEKRVPFKSRVVSLPTREQYEPWFLRLNPSGEVPVLTDGVKIIPDSVRIVEYLEDNFSNGQFGQLTPKEKGSEESKKIQHFRDLIEVLPVQVLTYGTAANPELQDNPKPPYTPGFMKYMADLIKNSPAAIRESADRNPEAREVLLAKAETVEKRYTREISNKEAVEKVLEDLDSVLQAVEEELASHTGDQSDWWLCGERISIADIDLAILLNRLNQLGHERRFWLEGKRPHLQTYWERIRHTSSFKRATYFSSREVRLNMLLGALKKSRGLLASLTAAVGIAAVSYIVYRRVQKS